MALNLLETAAKIVCAQAGQVEMSGEEISLSLRQTFRTLQRLNQMEDGLPAQIEEQPTAKPIQFMGKPVPRKMQPKHQVPVAWTEAEMNLLKQSIADASVNISSIYARHTRAAVYSRKVLMRKQAQEQKAAEPPMLQEAAKVVPRVIPTRKPRAPRAKKAAAASQQEPAPVAQAERRKVIRRRKSA